ncbi:zinc finger protein [Elysia marginata]|uniref:Zinc finger protein n=1 Tax=Elysia marginata TaxID=1093978 RepID=A0AAV4GGG5_9GAST|nr:zinc finger protein [Elysia marginata]
MAPKEFSKDAAFEVQLPNYNVKLWKSLHSQWRNQKFCDLKVVTTNGIVPMHSCVWSAFSDEMAKMVKEDAEAKSKFRLSVSLAVTSEVVLEIASVLYTGTFSPPKRLMAQLYSTVKYLEFSDLLDLIKKYYQDNSIDLLDEFTPSKESNHLRRVDTCEELEALHFCSKEHPNKLLERKGNNIAKGKKLRTLLNRIPQSSENSKFRLHQWSTLFDTESFSPPASSFSVFTPVAVQENSQNTNSEHGSFENGTLILKDRIKKEQDLDMEPEVFTCNFPSSGTLNSMDSWLKMRVKINRMKSKSFGQIPKSVSYGYVAGTGRMYIKNYANCALSNVQVEQSLPNCSLTCNSDSFEVEETSIQSNNSINTIGSILTDDVSTSLPVKKTTSSETISGENATSTPVIRPAQSASFSSHSDNTRIVDQTFQFSDYAVAEDAAQAVNNALNDHDHSGDCFITLCLQAIEQDHDYCQFPATGYNTDDVNAQTGTVSGKNMTKEIKREEDLNISEDSLLNSVLALDGEIKQEVDIGNFQSNKSRKSTTGNVDVVSDTTEKTYEDVHVTTARNIYKVRENPGGSVDIMRDNSFSKTRNIGKSSDMLSCTRKNSQTDQTPPNKDEPLKLPSKSAEISSVLPVRQGAGEASGSVEHSDSRLTSSTQISSTMINCFVSLEKLPEFETQLAISLDNDSSIGDQSPITSPFKDSATRTLSQTSAGSNKTGAETERLNDVVIWNSEVTNRASQQSSSTSQCSAVKNSKCDKSNCSKKQMNSYTKESTPLTPCKNTVGSRKTAREEGQAMEMDSHGNNLQSPEEYSRPVRKRKLSTRLAGCKLFGNPSLFQISEKKERRLKKPETKARSPRPSSEPPLLSSPNEAVSGSEIKPSNVYDNDSICNAETSGVHSKPNGTQEFSHEKWKLTVFLGNIDEKVRNRNDGEVLISDKPPGCYSNGPTLPTAAASFFECSECQRVFQKRENLTSHMYSVHKTCPISLHCSYCGHVAERPFELVQHSVQLHGDALPFKCPHESCSFSSSKRSDVVKHMMVHSSVKAVRCHRCGQHFKTVKNLQLHKNSCYNLKKYICEVCGRRFNIKSSMQKHVDTVHRGTKAYLCPDCGKTFSCNANLQRHMRIHKNSFPYPCQYCSAKFRHSNTLKDHAETKHGIHNFKPQKVL